MKVWLTIEEGDRAIEILRKFLERMPEVVVDPQSREMLIVRHSYSNDTIPYIIESFANFLDQVVPETPSEAKEI